MMRFVFRVHILVYASQSSVKGCAKMIIDRGRELRRGRASYISRECHFGRTGVSSVRVLRYLIVFLRPNVAATKEHA